MFKLGHWYPVSNLSLFCQKVLRKKEDGTVSKATIHKRYSVDTCSGCLKQHHLVKYDPRKDVGINPHCAKTGVFRYRDAYCPYELPDDMVLSFDHSRHIDLCANASAYLERVPETPTQIKTTNKKFYVFSNYGATVDHRYTGYFDLETFNTEIHPSCLECSELIEISRDKSRKEVTLSFIIYIYIFTNIFLGYLR